LPSCVGVCVVLPTAQLRSRRVPRTQRLAIDDELAFTVDRLRALRA
jgi:hypothetical protein